MKEMTLEQARRVIDERLKDCKTCPEFEGVHDCCLDCFEDVALPAARMIIADLEIKMKKMRCCSNCISFTEKRSVLRNNCKNKYIYDYDCIPYDYMYWEQKNDKN